MGELHGLDVAPTGAVVTTSRICLAITLALASPSTSTTWKQLAPGLELLEPDPLTIVRADPARWELEVLVAAEQGRTAAAWCGRDGIAAAINAGMFAADGSTHVGYLRHNGRVLSSHINGYRSVAAFDPKPGRDVPPFRIFDLDTRGRSMKAILRDYDSAVQNLRLIERPGVSRWNRRDRRWSEAALAEDEQGRILFVISRTPMTMPDFNGTLLGLGIGVVAAQHLEGGSWAQLAVDVGEARFEVVGNNGRARPIPSVLGLRPRASR